MEPFVHRTDRILEIEQWQQTVPRLVAGFTTRCGGMSKAPYESLNVGFHVNDEAADVRANRELLAGEIGFPLSRWVGSEQVHGSVIKKVTALDAGKGAASYETALKGIDGLYTAEENLLLTSVYADCVPLFFFAPKRRLIGLAHAGWRGTVKRIGPAMLKIWQTNEWIPLSEVQVVLGPSISAEAYEVDQKVITAVNECLTEDEPRPYDKRIGAHTYSLDLRALNKQLLMEAGLKEEQIISSSICTATDKRMFSYRCEGGETGRMMSFIGIQP